VDIEQLKHDLKVMIIDECEKEDISPEEVPNDAELFSEESGLELDSVDGLQISMAIQKEYGVRLVDPKEFRRVVKTINSIAEYIQEKNA